MTAPQNHKIIHVARIQPQGRQVQYLYLKMVDPHRFSWFSRENKEYKDTKISAGSVVEAIHLARRAWKRESFRTVNCGFRYTLPERDEHGSNALFHQMCASYSTSNGVYFDEELGNNCFVNFASQEARMVWEQISYSP